MKFSSKWNEMDTKGKIQPWSRLVHFPLFLVGDAYAYSKSEFEPKDTCVNTDLK